MRLIVIVLMLLLAVQSAPSLASSKGAESARLLDINGATAEALADTLPGIGPAKAALIIQWRKENGSFKHIDQLQEVKGIGLKTVDKLRPYIRVGSEAAAMQMRREHKEREDKIAADVQRLINAATFSAKPASLNTLPAKAWYRKSILEILRTH